MRRRQELGSTAELTPRQRLRDFEGRGPAVQQLDLENVHKEPTTRQPFLSGIVQVNPERSSPRFDRRFLYSLRDLKRGC